MRKSTPVAEGRYNLRLYVANGTPRSVLALAHLKKLCQKHLANRYHIEVIDLAKNPELAQADQIVAVPTLVRKLPIPIRRFIGTLADTERVLIDFRLHPQQAETPAGGEKGKYV